MALHWEHLKGFNADDNGNTLYTFLKFANGAATGENQLPTVWVNTSNSYPSSSLGHIITSSCASTFTQLMTFSAGITVADTGTFNGAVSLNNMTTVAINKRIQFGNETSYITGNSSSNSLDIYHGSAINLKGGTNAVANIQMPCNVSGNVNATYFNATSDVRAKDNLIPFSLSALDIINRTQVYTFNYRKDPLHRTLGVIAQDLVDLNLDGASLVDNLKATGLNDDFMQVHETKLIYILWKAVQELSLEVKILKEKLGE